MIFGGFFVIGSDLSSNYAKIVLESSPQMASKHFC